MPNDKAGLGLLIIGGLVLWGLSRAKPEVVPPKVIPIFPPPKPPIPPKLPVLPENIVPLINESVSAMNEAREFANIENWAGAAVLAEQAVQAAKKAEELAGVPIQNQRHPDINLVQQAESHLTAAREQIYWAAQTSPTGYAAGGYENAADFGYGAGVF